MNTETDGSNLRQIKWAVIVIAGCVVLATCVVCFVAIRSNARAQQATRATRIAEEQAIVRAKLDTVQLQMTGLSNDLARYKMHVGRYPAQLRDLLVCPNDPEIKDRWGGPYLDSEERLFDVWKSELEYVTGARSYEPPTIRSAGPNTVFGDDDDIAYKCEDY